MGPSSESDICLVRASSTVGSKNIQMSCFCLQGVQFDTGRQYRFQCRKQKPFQVYQTQRNIIRGMGLCKTTRRDRRAKIRRPPLTIEFRLPPRMCRSEGGSLLTTLLQRPPMTHEGGFHVPLKLAAA